MEQPFNLAYCKIRAYEDSTLILLLEVITQLRCLILCIWNISLRIVHSNGAVDEKDIDLGIKPFN